MIWSVDDTKSRRPIRQQLVIEYRGGPADGRDDVVRTLPPLLRYVFGDRHETYRPTGETTATGRHIYQWDGQA
jgi:hypothetical protein